VLTIHLHFVSRLKMGIAILLLSLTSQMACYEFTFIFTFTLHSTADHNNPYSGHECVSAFFMRIMAWRWPFLVQGDLTSVHKRYWEGLEIIGLWDQTNGQ